MEFESRSTPVARPLVEQPLEEGLELGGDVGGELDGVLLVAESLADHEALFSVRRVDAWYNAPLLQNSTLYAHNHTHNHTAPPPHLDDVVDEAIDAVGVEGRLPHIQLVQDHAQRPQINLDGEMTCM